MNMNEKELVKAIGTLTGISKIVARKVLKSSSIEDASNTEIASNAFKELIIIATQKAANGIKNKIALILTIVTGIISAIAIIITLIAGGKYIIPIIVLVILVLLIWIISGIISKRVANNISGLILNAIESKMKPASPEGNTQPT